MMKKVKRLTAAFFAVCIAACSVFAASAEATDKLIDDADLYSASEELQIESGLEEASRLTGWDFAIYTNTNGVESEDMQDYCDEYYINHGYGKNTDNRGIFLVIDMNSRELYVTTKGETMYYVNDDRLDDILDDIQFSLMDDEYVEAAEYFVNDAVGFYNSGKPTSGSFSNVEYVEKKENPFWYVLTHYGIIILLVSMGIAAISAVGVKKKYKNNGKENTYDLSSNSKVRLTTKEDTFLTKHVSVTTISSSSGGSGRSGGGRSGGSSRGGGGRSF